MTNAWLTKARQQAEREGNPVAGGGTPLAAGKRPVARVPSKRRRPGAKPKPKVRLTAAGLGQLEKAKALSYALHEAQWQDRLALKGKRSSSTASADLERTKAARRRQRIRALSR